MRIVLDTNVVVSALLWRGTPYRLLHTLRTHKEAQLFTSVVLLEELAEVLLRAVPAQRLALIGVTARQVLQDYIEAVDVVTPLVTPRMILADADDDHVIAAAMAADAQLVVSGDRHLLTATLVPPIRIVRAAEALEIVQP